MNSLSCADCQLKDDCDFLDADFDKHRFQTVSEFINLAMKYRSQGFYSFRGQRNVSWDLGVNFKLKDFSDGDVEHALRTYKRRCLSLPKVDNISEEDEWRWMFMAQHYGLRTKLLDWSSNPLVALYFAVENIVSKQDDMVSGAVWGLKVEDDYFLTPSTAGHPDYIVEGENEDKKKKKKIKKNEWYMLNPAPITPRIYAQSGKFSYHPNSITLITEDEEVGKRNRQLVLFCIDSNEKEKANKNIRKHLGIMNIHHASMFPDHAGIASFINEELKGLNPNENDPAYINIDGEE